MKKLTNSEITNLIRSKQKKIKNKYIIQDKTAKEIAEQEGIECDSNFKRTLYREIGSKGKGWGGKRKNAGNKKGIVFCKKCKKKKSNCQC